MNTLTCFQTLCRRAFDFLTHISFKSLKFVYQSLLGFEISKRCIRHLLLSYNSY